MGVTNLPSISLTDFVDFAIASGPSQLTKIKEIINRGAYDPKVDFWKPLRQGIREFHQNGRELSLVLEGLTDPKKINRYPSAVKAYKKFVKQNSPKWFKPPSNDWNYSELVVRINPELGIEANGRRYAAKLYFKDEKLTNHRLKVVFELMRLGLHLESGVIPAVIDVTKSRLLAPKPLDVDLSALLQAQALAFVHMWKAVSGN